MFSAFWNLLQTSENLKLVAEQFTFGANSPLQKKTPNLILTEEIEPKLSEKFKVDDREKLLFSTISRTFDYPISYPRRGSNGYLTERLLYKITVPIEDFMERIKTINTEKKEFRGREDSITLALFGIFFRLSGFCTNLRNKRFSQHILLYKSEKFD